MTRPFTIALPTDDRQRTYTFYRETLRLDPIGDPTGGFGWVLGDRLVAPWEPVAGRFSQSPPSRSGVSLPLPLTLTAMPGRSSLWTEKSTHDTRC